MQHWARDENSCCLRVAFCCVVQKERQCVVIRAGPKPSVMPGDAPGEARLQLVSRLSSSLTFVISLKTKFWSWRNHLKYSFFLWTERTRTLDILGVWERIWKAINLGCQGVEGKVPGTYYILEWMNKNVTAVWIQIKSLFWLRARIQLPFWSVGSQMGAKKLIFCINF